MMVNYVSNSFKFIEKLKFITREKLEEKAVFLINHPIKATAAALPLIVLMSLYQNYNGRIGHTTNTYGLRSITRRSFNVSIEDKVNYPKEAYHFFCMLMRINNAFFNILGYSKLAVFSGPVRVVIWSFVLGLSIILGDPRSPQGILVDKYYYEVRDTAIVQITRGIAEASSSTLSKKINLSLDVVHTIVNLMVDAAERDRYQWLFTRRSVRTYPAGVSKIPHKQITYAGVVNVLLLF